MLKNIAFRHRLIGAIFVISLGIIVIPAIFDSPAVDTLAVKESLPVAPDRSDWQELQVVDYSFTELVNDLQTEEVQHELQAPASIEQPVKQASDNTLAPLTTAAPDTSLQVAQQETNVVTPEPVAPTAAAEPTIAPAQAEEVIQATEKLIAKNNTWAVQLGAFSKTENANALVERLKDKGYAAYIQEMGEQKLARVLVGVEADQKKAAALLSELDQTMHLKGIIVQFAPENAS